MEPAEVRERVRDTAKAVCDKCFLRLERQKVNIRQTENELFEKWKLKYSDKPFISDGVFCPEQWENEAIRITFVLKEANWSEDDCDLCEYLLSEPSGTYGKTWNNIVRWAEAILEGNRFVEKIENSDKTRWLKRISFLNLKKVGGGGKADSELIREFAHNDAVFIWEQLNLYQPDIIVCCGRGTGKNADLLYEEVIPHNMRGVWNKKGEAITERRYNFFHIKFPGVDKETPVVSFLHPQQYSTKTEKLEQWYNDMRDISERLLKNR